MLRDMKKEEERLWSMQQEHMRRLQVIADQKMKRGLREVDMATRATQAQQAAEAKEFWKDPYGEAKPTFESK